MLLSRRGPELDMERLERWLNSQDGRVIKTVQGLPTDHLPSDRLAVVVRVTGRCVDRIELVDAPEERLVRMFGAMLRSVEQVQEARMFPDLSPGLLWETDDAAVVSALVPLDGPAGSQANQVRLLAQAFYRWASGVDPTLLAASPPPLKNWSKFAGDGLSRLIDRCIASTTPRDAITTFVGAAAALTRLGSTSGSLETPLAASWRTNRCTSPPDRGRQGLGQGGGNARSQGPAGPRSGRAGTQSRTLPPLRADDPQRRVVVRPAGLRKDSHCSSTSRGAWPSLHSEIIPS